MMSELIRNAILAAVPEDGSTIGNLKLYRAVREALGGDRKSITEEAFQSLRDALIAEGVLGRGRGRGGSIFLTNTGPSATSGEADSDANVPAQADDNGGSGAPEAAPEAAGGFGLYDTYQHREKATQRPDVGIQEQFSQRRAPKRYRYDSSLAPELCWDENAQREFADWLLTLITEAAEQGEQRVFAEPQRWLGTGEQFRSMRECIACLKSLTKPFLNWAGKAERQEISVPTVPLFVHERHSTRAILERLESYKAAGQNLDLFGDPNLDLADKLDAYEHQGPWTNRLILGDSLQVMNSLLEYEGLGGQAQEIPAVI
jgi:adenine-specific DNA-methyltransferase